MLNPISTTFDTDSAANLRRELAQVEEQLDTFDG